MIGLIGELGDGFRQVALRILKRLGDERLQRNVGAAIQRVAGEEEHLAREPGDAFDTVAHRVAERRDELGVVAAFGEQLLIGRNRHDGVADFVRETFGHAFDEAQIRGLDLEGLRAFNLREILDEQQRGVGRGGFLAVEKRDAELENQLGIFWMPETERRRIRPRIERGKHAAAHDRGQIAEFQRAHATVGGGEKVSRGGIGLEDGEVTADDDAAAGKLRHHVGHHLEIARELVVQPTVADRQPEFLEEMKHQPELLVGERLAGDAAVEHRDPDHRFAIENGKRDLRAEQFKFLENFAIHPRLVAAVFQNASVPVEVTADAGLEGQFKIIHQARRKADGAGRAQLAVILRRARGGHRGRRTAQENAGAIHAENAAQQHEEFLEQRFGAQAVRENAREISEHLERARRGHGGVLRTKFLDEAGRRSSGQRRLAGRLPEARQQGVQDFTTNGFGQNVIDPQQVGFLLPLPFRIRAVHEDRQPGGQRADLFQRANGLNVGEFEVEDAGINRALPNEGLDLPQLGFRDDAVLPGVNHRAYGRGGTR